MSHFSTLVLLDPEVNAENEQAVYNRVEKVLFPYCEDTEVFDDTEGLKFELDPDGYHENENGEKGWYYNPDAHWDWWLIGGRWNNEIHTNSDEYVNICRAKDIDFSPTKKEVHAAKDFWKRYVMGEGVWNSQEDGFVFYKPEYYKERYKSLEKYVEAITSFSTFAIVTEDGIWHEKGEVGWFGVSNETDEEALEWESSFVDRFLKDIDPETVVVMVDCHI